MNEAQSVADAVIGFAETHLQPVTEWERRVIRWAFRGDGRQPLVIDGHYIGDTTPKARVNLSDPHGMSATNPAQIPHTLMEPAMDAGQPPELTPEGARFATSGVKVEYASFRRSDLDPLDPGAPIAAINNMAASGWRLITFDGERYIFERPARDGNEPHER